MASFISKSTDRISIKIKFSFFQWHRRQQQVAPLPLLPLRVDLQLITSLASLYYMMQGLFIEQPFNCQEI